MTAHSVSLPLFNAIQNNNGKPAWDALCGISHIIKCLSLEKDIQPVVLILAHATCIDLQPESAYGREVLHEAKVRSEFLPCPDGECEYDASSNCRWCGKAK